MSKLKKWTEEKLFTALTTYLLGVSRINYDSRKMTIEIEIFGYGMDNYKYLLDQIIDQHDKGKKITYTQYEKLRKEIDKR